MSRYSPSVLPDGGPRFDPNAIADAIAGFQREQEHAADRKTAEEDRTQANAEHQQDRTYLTAQRQRQGALDTAQDYDAGFRTGPKPSPLAARIGQLRSDMQNPMSAAMPVRRLPGQLDHERQSFQEALADEGRYQALPDGRYRDLDATPEGIQRRNLQEQGERASDVARRMGASPEEQKYFQIHPEAIDDLLKDHRTLERDQATTAATNWRTKVTTDAATRRTEMTEAGANSRNQATIAGENSRSQATIAGENSRATAARTSGTGAGGLTQNQALTQARALAQQYDTTSGTNSLSGREGLVEELAATLMSGGNVESTISDWETRHEPPAKGPGWFSRAIGAVKNQFSSDGLRSPQPATAVDVETRTDELMQGGYDDDQILDILNEEGLID